MKPYIVHYAPVMHILSHKLRILSLTFYPQISAIYIIRLDTKAKIHIHTGKVLCLYNFLFAYITRNIGLFFNPFPSFQSDT
jgi:hypothetical protein